MQVQHLVDVRIDKAIDDQGQNLLQQVAEAEKAPANVVQAGAGPSSLATTIRLMAGQELVTEGFKEGQVGSSAMPHKMNTRSCERGSIATGSSSNVQPRRIVPSAARAAPGWPSICW